MSKTFKRNDNYSSLEKFESKKLRNARHKRRNTLPDGERNHTVSAYRSSFEYV